MEMDDKTPRWVAWAWQGVSVLSLLFAILIWGGDYSQKLDYWGEWVRAFLNYPVRSDTKPMTKSPDGKWEITRVSRRFTYQQKSYSLMSQKDEIIARRNGKIFLGGRNLDPDYRFSIFRRYYNPKVSWPDNSLVKFDNHQVVISAVEDGTTITLTVENRTGAEIPYVIARYCDQTLIFFEMAAHSSSRVSFTAPMPNRYYPYDAMGSRMGCMVGTSGTFVWDQQNYHALRWETYESTITLHDGMKPDIQFKPVSEVKAP